MPSIRTSPTSLRLQSGFNRASERLSDSARRLSSGLRITKASDDAAGLSVADKLRVSSRVFNQGIRNLNDGIGFINILEGQLTSLSQLLTRQLELAEQGANGVLSSSQRLALNQEAQELGEEYERILRATDLNGNQFLDIYSDPLDIQAGFGLSGRVSLDLTPEFQSTRGSGAFTVADSTSGAFFPERPQLGDVNGDWYLDAAVVEPSAGAVSVFYGGEGGSFTASGDHPLTGGDARDLALGDFDGDGRQDVVSVSDGGGIQTASQQGNSFQNLGTSASGSSFSSVVSLDFSGDGVLDVVVSDQASGALRSYTGNGDGTFSSAGSIALGGAPGDLEATDLDGDGRLEVLSLDSSAGSVSVLQVSGSGNFDVQESISTGPSARELKTGDFNNDGLVDVAVANFGDNTVSLALGNGDSTFEDSVAHDTNVTGGRPYGLAVGDINGDGRDDILVTSDNTNEIGAMLSNSEGTFDTTVSSAGNNPRGLSLTDLNGDGVLDIVLGSRNSGSLVTLFSDTEQGATALKAPELDLTAVSGAKQALGLLGVELSKATQQIGVLGSGQSRLQTAVSVLSTEVDNFLAAESRIRDVDVAEEMVRYTTSNILREVSASLIRQHSLDSQRVLELLR